MELAQGIVRILTALRDSDAQSRHWIPADSEKIFELHQTLLGETLVASNLSKRHKAHSAAVILQNIVIHVCDKVQVKLCGKTKQYWIALKDEDAVEEFKAGAAVCVTRKNGGWGALMCNTTDEILQHFQGFKRISAEFGVDFGAVDAMDAFEKSEILLQRVYELGYKRIVAANLIKEGSVEKQRDIAKNSELIAKVKQVGLNVRQEFVKFQDLTMNDLLSALEDNLLQLKKAHEKIEELLSTCENTENVDSLQSMEEIKQYQEMESDLIVLQKENADLKKRIAEIEAQNERISSISLNESIQSNRVSDDEQSSLDIVGKIRAEKGSLLMDLDASPNVKTTLNSLYRSLDSAVQRLAEDIYSSKTRFFLELVQNADDNSYGVNVQPQLSIDVDLSKKFIWTRNNELGFSDDNLRAICDIGGSTKQNNQSIGYKGIGFKSVFKITDTPMILSGSINVYFDCRKKLGYLLPNNLTSDSYEMLRSNGISKDDHGTNFFLPFKNDVDIEMFRNEVDQIFDSLEFIILFTRKISKMHLNIIGNNNATLGKSVEILKKNIGKYEQYTLTTVCNFIQSSSKNCLFRKVVNIPFRFRKNRNEESTETEIALAFTEEEKEYPIYSYLPVKNVGFKFIINANFELTANRQDIHESDGWNIFLRDQIPAILCEALKFLDIDAQRVIYLIPSVSEIRDPFWKVLAEQFRRLFIDQEIILGQSGCFRKTSELLLRSNILSDLFSTDELWMTLKKEYVHTSLEIYKEQLTEKLGISEISVFDVIKVLENLDLSQKSNEWFLRLYEYLYNAVCGSGSLDVISSQELLQAYSRLKILPKFRTSSFEFVSFLDGPLFYDIDEAVIDGSLIIPEIVKLIHIKDPSVISIKFFELLGAKKAGFRDVFDALVSYNYIYSTSIRAEFCIEQFKFLYRNRDKIIDSTTLRKLLDLYFISDEAKTFKLSNLSIRSNLLECLNSLYDKEFQFVSTLGIDIEYEQIWFESIGVRSGPALNAENPQNSLVNVLKVFPVVGNLEINCSFLVYLDRYWTEISCDLSFLSEFKATNETKPFLKSIGYHFGVAFLEKPFKSEFRLHHLPYLSLNISNSGFLSQIGVFDSFTLKCANTIAKQIYPYILRDVNESARSNTWKVFYEVLQNLNFGNVLQNIYLPDIGYVERFEMVFQGDSNLAKLLNMKVMSLVYPHFRSLLVEQFGANLTFTLKNILHGLKTISQRSHANSFIESLSGDELLKLVIGIYEFLDDEVKNEPLNENQRMNLPIFLENQIFKSLRECSNFMIVLKDQQNYQGMFGGKLMFVHPALLNCEALWNCVGILKASSIIETSISTETKRYSARNDYWANIYCSVLKKLASKYKSLLRGQNNEALKSLMTNLTVFESQILKVSYKIKCSNQVLNDLESEREEYFLFDKTRFCLFLWSNSWFDLGTSGFLFKAMHSLFPFIDLEKLKASITFEELQGYLSREIQEKHGSMDLQSYPVIDPRGRKRKIFSENPNGKKLKPENDFDQEEDDDLSNLDLSDAVNEIKRSVLKISPDASKVRMVNTPYYVERELSQPDPYTEKQNRMVGNLGECFAYQLISSWISSANHAPFSVKNWVSSARKEFFLNESAIIDDGLGYDMYYEDFTGVIPCMGRIYEPAPARKITWMFEVKSHLNRQRMNRFFLSKNEWDVASRSTNSISSEYRYVIIGVVLRPEPKLAYWLEDPYEMNRRGHLFLESKQFIASNYPRLL